MPRFLTKSRFKLALDCPAKLYYTDKPEYPDAKKHDAFLEALAEGGYQVGALAKCYYPDGVEIGDRGYDIPLQKSKDLLTQENVVIFEAAFQYQNLFIRADIIEKIGNTVNLLEVKAKSFDGNDCNDMLTKKGFLDSKWREYVYDVAFQKYVINKACPDLDVRAYLILADKNSIATVDGLNQKFQLKTVADDRTTVEIIGDVSKEGLGKEVLIRICVDEILEKIYNGTDSQSPPEKSFEEYVHFWADKYEKDEKIVVLIHKDCKDCEFDFSPEEQSQGKLSGFRECWKAELGWNDENFNEPLILDLWNYRKKQNLIDSGIYYLKDIQQVHLGNISPEKDGSLSTAERQSIQIEKVRQKDPTPYINVDSLKRELDLFKFPLHFIDFETSMVAIPFYKGRRPYEQTAFQFSHHIVTSDLKIEHKGQYLCTEKGCFPNFDFVRKLKSELEHDSGSVFRYANHENTVLNQILQQLESVSAEEVRDKHELMEFIKTITHGANHKGDRDMIDLLELVKKYYYHPVMGGSNSLKYVLPAILNSSDYIQTKYSQPIYGKNSEILSLNYDDGWVWIKKDDKGVVINPYKLLPPIFEHIDEDQIEEFLMRSDIQDGGSAMTAYAKMQFTLISDIERELISKALLKYCELDTLAMVLLLEYWNDITSI
jgi:hypothetical protein